MFPPADSKTKFLGIRKAFLPNRQLLGLGMDVFFRYGEIKVLPNFAKKSTLTP